MTTEELFNIYSKFTHLTEEDYEYLVSKKDFKEALIEFAKYHVKEALIKAEDSLSAEKLDYVDYYDFSKGVKTVFNSDRDYISECYGLDNIR